MRPGEHNHHEEIEVPGICKAVPSHSPFVPLSPIGLYAYYGADVLHMPSCKGFLSFFLSTANGWFLCAMTVTSMPSL